VTKARATAEAKARAKAKQKQGQRQGQGQKPRLKQVSPLRRKGRAFGRDDKFWVGCCVGEGARALRVSGRFVALLGMTKAKQEQEQEQEQKQEQKQKQKQDQKQHQEQKHSKGKSKGRSDSQGLSRSLRCGAKGEPSVEMISLGWGGVWVVG
jgi:hypothetical protein